VISLEVAWQMAKGWYHDRLDPSWARMTKEEAEGLLAGLGLDSEFWRL
jgi:hypothetical protein